MTLTPHALNVPLFSSVCRLTAGNASLTARLQDASAAAPSAFSLHAPVSWNQLDATAVIAVPLPSFATPALRLFRPESAVLEPRVQPLATALLEAVFTNPPLIAAPVTLHADPVAGRIQTKPFPGSRRVLAELWEGRLSFRIYGEPLDLTASGVWNETVARVQDGWDWIHDELQNEQIDPQEALGRVSASLKDVFVLSALRRVASGRLKPQGSLDQLLAEARTLLRSGHASETMELLFRLRRRLEKGTIPVAAEAQILDDILNPYDDRLAPLLAELRRHLRKSDDDERSLLAAVELIRLGETDDAEEIFWARSNEWFWYCEREQILNTILALDPHDCLERLGILSREACEPVNENLLELCVEAIGRLEIPKAFTELNALIPHIKNLIGRNVLPNKLNLFAAAAYARMGDVQSAKKYSHLSDEPEKAHVLIHFHDEVIALRNALSASPYSRDVEFALASIHILAIYKNGGDTAKDLLDHKNVSVRIAAAEALGDRQTLLNRLEDPQAWIAIASAEALMRLGDFDDAQGRLLEVFKNDTDIEASGMVLEAMGRLFPPEFAKELHAFLDDSYWTKRWGNNNSTRDVGNVISSLGKIGNPASLPLLLPFLDSENFGLVIRAAKAVAALGRPEEARRALTGLLRRKPESFDLLSSLIDLVSRE